MKFEIALTFSITSSDESFMILDHLYAKETKRILAFASPIQYQQLLIIQTIDHEKYDVKKVFVYLVVFLS